MSIEEILDELDELIDSAKQIPFSGGKISVDYKMLSSISEQMRLNLPSEIKQAQHLVNDRKAIINDAKAEANTIVRKAEEKAKTLIAEEAIAKQAQQRAQDILTNAQNKSKEIKTATNTYVENMLTRLDELMTSNTADVRKMLSAVKNNKN